jgi:signal transduction histidine kinase
MGASALSLYKIVHRTVLLREAIETGRVKQMAELGELAAGIAHEIRNPINAIRLNLHALGRLQEYASSQMSDESAAAIAEANREIERVEGLMRVMLGYARPQKPSEEDVDLRWELEAVLTSIQPIMERDGACVLRRLPPSSLYVHLDRNRFHQITLGLLNNARESVGREGRIEVSLARRGRDTVEVVVSDNGPGVPPTERDRIFDPIYSTKQLGTGLGLALVKRFVEEAKGQIVCESNDLGGASFRISFPEAARDTVVPIPSMSEGSHSEPDHSLLEKGV